MIFKIRNIITCGADGDYRVWKGYEDDDPECIRVGDEATAITFKVLGEFYSYLFCLNFIPLLYATAE